MSRRTPFLVAAAAAALTFSLGAPALAADAAPGAVYALTNSPAGNAVVAYDRGADGTLEPAGSTPTGGAGSGAGLGSQGAVAVARDARLVFAVNAGSNTVTSLRIRRGGGLDVVDSAPSGGVLPTSVTYRSGLLYVLNAGAPNSVSALRVDAAGRLTPLAGSTRALSGDQTSPAQVSFDAGGDALIVTEKATNVIDSFAVGPDGRLGERVAQPSAGPTPFGFAVSTRNVLFVSEAGPGGGASTYAIGRLGAPAPISPNVVTGQRAACWAVVTRDGRFGYVTNAATGNVSGFALGADGSATLLDPTGVSATTGGNPSDVALSHDGRFMFVRVAALAQIAVFAVGHDGALTPLTPLGGAPAGLVGLAAF